MSTAVALLSLSIFISFLNSYLYQKRALAYSLFASFLLVAHLVTRDYSSVYRMFYLISITFFWIKSIVLIQYDFKQNAAFTLKERLLFIFAWVGMKPTPFLAKQSVPSKGTIVIFKLSLIFVVLGLSLLFIINKTAPHAAFSVPAKWIVSYLSLFAISCVLHFGFIPLSTVIIRMCGYPAPSFFINPFKSKSLAAFWGSGWNVPYADMIEDTVFKPLKKYGLEVSIAASFVFSGILHEIAFSVPINAGYGLPTIYFLIQSILILTERKYLRKNPVLKKTLMYAALLFPLPLLFHPPFMKEIIWPLLNFS